MISTKTSIELQDALTQYEPKMSIVVYQKESGNTDFYIEQAKIENGTVQSYSPMSTHVIKSIFAQTSAAEKGMVTIDGMMPKNILHLQIVLGDFRIIWHNKAQIRLIKFAKECRLRNVKAKVPAMIYEATRTQLKVYCITKRPSMKTELYNAPYFNVFEDGRVCMGSMKLDLPGTVDVSEIMDTWEKFFWLSEFTEVADTSTKKYWHALSKEITGVFEDKWLTKQKTFTTLISLINGNDKRR